MTNWDVRLGKRQSVIKVAAVVKRAPEFMIVTDDQGKQHHLSEVDFPFFDWENIKVDSTITLTISESVTRWRIQSPRIKKNVKELFYEAQKKAVGLYFIWVCEHCGTSGFVEYEDGDDPQGINERVLSEHAEKSLPDCPQTIRIFDHRGSEQQDSELLLSSQRV